MNDWLKLVKHQVEASTYAAYKHIVENRVIPYFEPLGLNLMEVEAKHYRQQ